MCAGTSATDFFRDRDFISFPSLFPGRRHRGGGGVRGSADPRPPTAGCPFSASAACQRDGLPNESSFEVLEIWEGLSETR